MGGWTVVMCGCGRLDAGVLWVVWMAGLVEMDMEPPPQSESSMFPPLLQPAPQPFCNLPREAGAGVLKGDKTSEHRCHESHVDVGPPTCPSC